MRTPSFFYFSTEFQRLLILLIIKIFFIIGLILYGNIGLGPDEAQYWTWSRALDWGYYSKPPAIAWQIWLGSQGFGQTELGVRIFSLLIATLQSISVYRLAICCGLRVSTAFWSGVVMAFCPIGILGSLFAITDGGFLLFWTLAACVVASALTQKQEPSPVVIGLLIACGALFKWPIYFFWVFFLIAYYWQFPQLNWRQVLMGITLSFAGLLPSLWWNISHDWATFRHVLATAQGGSVQVSQGNIFEFLGSQILLFSPILFGLLGFSYWNLIRKFNKMPAAIIFCGVVSLGSLAFFLVFALFQKMQGNWSICAYPTGIVLLSWGINEGKTRFLSWLKGGVILSVLLVSMILMLPSFPHLLSYRINPFKHNMGWVSLKEALEKGGYNSEEHFLVSDKYQTTSLLSFYNPGQKRAYFINLWGIRKNQFSYWPPLIEEQKGKTGYFVWVENAPELQKNWKAKLNHYQIKLEKYFEKVEFLGVNPLVYQNTQMVKGAFIFKCQNCISTQPEDVNLY